MAVVTDPGAAVAAGKTSAPWWLLDRSTFRYVIAVQFQPERFQGLPAICRRFCEQAAVMFP